MSQPQISSNGNWGRGTGPTSPKEGSAIDARKDTPQARYDRVKTRMYTIKAVTTTEADIIQRLDSEPNKAGYIKRLIRADIANSK